MCPVISEPSNGSSLNCTETSIGDKCNFLCNEGFYNSGNSSATCVDPNPKNDNDTDGKWDGGATCVVITCGELDDPDNGKANCGDSTNITFQGTCPFLCNDGYSITADQEANCTDPNSDQDNWDDGLWVGDPSCTAYMVLSTTQEEMTGVKCENLTIIVTVENQFEDVVSITVNMTYPPSNTATLTKGDSEDGITTYQYTVTDLKEENAGKYVVKSYSLNDDQDLYPDIEMEQNIQVTINVPPEDLRFSTKNQSYHTYVRGSLDNLINCSANGSPTPVVGWLNEKGDSIGLNAEGVSSYSESGNAVLNLEEAYFNNTGFYTCVATSQVGQGKEERQMNITIQIMVEGSPVLEGDATTLSPQDNINLTCNADASPQPTFIWERNETPYKDDELFTDIGSVSDNNDEKSYTYANMLTLRAQLCVGRQKIDCNAKNTYGESDKSYSFVINDGTYGLHGVSYFTISSEEVDYNSTKQACSDVSGTLAIVTDTDTQKYLLSLENDEGFYVDARKKNDIWQWGDGTEIEESYWPKNDDGDCAIFDPGYDGNLTAVQCSQIHPYSCQLPASGIPKSLRITAPQCNGTTLGVEWISDDEFFYTEHGVVLTSLNGTKNSSVPVDPRISLVNITAEPDTLYNVKVSSGIDVCGMFYPSSSVDVVTGYGRPKNITDLEAALQDAKCFSTWKYDENMEWQIDYYNVVVKTSLNIQTTSQVEEQESSGTTYEASFDFETEPNSKYEISVSAQSCAGIGNYLAIKEVCVTDVEAPTAIVIDPTGNSGDSPTINPSNGIPINIPAPDQRSGPISCVFVVVAVDDSKTRSDEREKPSTNLSYFEDIESREDDSQYFAYATSDTTHNITITLGRGEKSSCTPVTATNRRKRSTVPDYTIYNATNDGLSYGKYYRYYVYTTTPDGSTFLVGASDLSIIIITESEENLGWIAGVVVPIVLIIAVVVGFLYYRKEHSTKSKEGDMGMHQFPSDDENVYENVAAESLRPLPLRPRELENVYFFKHADEDRIFREEYQDMKRWASTLKWKFTYSKNLSVKDRNRYINVLPADDSRVKLSHRPGDEYSDYINASYIERYGKKGKYIAAQGPKPNTVNDFWRMIWEENVEAVVMLTNVDENGKRKCEQYWPDENEQRNYGDISVETVNVSFLGPIVRRNFEVSKPNTSTRTRLVVQYHYISWPDHGVPATTTDLFHLRRIIKTEYASCTSPVVAHCSAGVGRTGTFMALDNLMDELEQRQEVDIKSEVARMRQNRTEMVQTLDQYVLLHKMMLETHVLKETDMDITAAEEKISRMKSGNTSEIEREFGLINRIPPMDTDRDLATSADHVHKNRDANVTPYDHNAITIRMRPDERSVPYINASAIVGYEKDQKFIVAQDPMAGTEELYWRMILDHDVKCIVMIRTRIEQEPCAKYWPDHHGVHFGRISTTLQDSEQHNTFNERTIFVKETVLSTTRSSTVEQFEFIAWPEEGNDTNDIDAILDLITRVQRHKQNTDNSSGPILVHCGDGSNHTGTFCAITKLLERLKTESRIDVVRTVKDLRDMRPHMVGDLSDYKLCYKAIEAYLGSFDLYSNFR